MKPTAIVYTSDTGHTAAYAQLLSEQIGLPVYSLKESKTLAKDTPVIYMGWLMASYVKGYKKAVKKLDIQAVCGVGLCNTGALLKEARKAIDLTDDIPLFTLQGGMDKEKLKGVNKFMINMLTKSLEKKENPTEDDQHQLTLLQKGGNFVSKDNLTAVLNWWNGL